MYAIESFLASYSAIAALLIQMRSNRSWFVVCIDSDADQDV